MYAICMSNDKINRNGSHSVEGAGNITVTMPESEYISMLEQVDTLNQIVDEVFDDLEDVDMECVCIMCRYEHYKSKQSGYEG